MGAELLRPVLLYSVSLFLGLLSRLIRVTLANLPPSPSSVTSCPRRRLSTSTTPKSRSPRSGRILLKLFLGPLSRTVRLLSSEMLRKPNLTCSHSVKKRVTIYQDALSACTSSEAIVVATEWKEFRDINWQAVYDSMNKPAFVFDGRMLLDAQKLREIGFKVTVIGRG